MTTPTLSTRIEVGDLVVETVSLPGEDLKALISKIQDMRNDPNAALVVPYPVRITHNPRCPLVA